MLFSPIFRANIVCVYYEKIFLTWSDPPKEGGKVVDRLEMIKTHDDSCRFLLPRKSHI